MNKSRCRVLAILSVLFLIGLLSKGIADQSKTRATQLVGTWSLVLVDNVLADGGRIHLYGPDPQGILTFDAEGRYSLQIYRLGRPKLASNDKAKGTPEENSAAVQGANSHFGRYSINETDRTVTFFIDHASFANWEGTQQKRSFTLAADHLKYTVPVPTSGGAATGEVEWERAR
jgi:hypothetical protein